jgi:5'-nucleotidase
MNRRFFIRNAAIGSAGILTGAFPYRTFAADDFSVITILHTNDLHSHIEPFDHSNTNYAGRGGFARISAVIKEYKKSKSGYIGF